MRKVEGGQILSPGQLCSWRPPVQPPGNHQVKHQPEIAFDTDGDALADAPQFPHYVAFRGGNRRPCGSQQKGAAIRTCSSG